MATKVYLSPSDQKNNKYTGHNVSEADVCRDIAEYAEKALKRNGFNVKLANKRYNINQRVNESNTFGADVHIPIHTNAGGGDGTLVLCYSGNEKNVYVKSVYNSVAKLTPTKDDGIRVNNNLAECSQTRAVCVYLECEFHDTKAYANWIIKNKKAIGEAIAKGMCAAEGKTYKGEATTSKPSESGKNGMYRVQVGAYSNKTNADAQSKKLKDDGFSTYIYKEDGLYKVQVGAYSKKENAEATKKKLEQKGYSTFIVYK